MEYTVHYRLTIHDNPILEGDMNVNTPTKYHAKTYVAYLMNMDYLETYYNKDVHLDCQVSDADDAYIETFPRYHNGREVGSDWRCRFCHALMGVFEHTHMEGCPYIASLNKAKVFWEAIDKIHALTGESKDYIVLVIEQMRNAYIEDAPKESRKLPKPLYKQSSSTISRASKSAEIGTFYEARFIMDRRLNESQFGSRWLHSEYNTL